MKTFCTAAALVLSAATVASAGTTTTLVPSGQWRLAGNAITTGTGLQLTNNLPFQIGSAYLRDTQFVRDGFDISFQYTSGIPGQNTNATGEGLAFVIQNQAPSALGGPASGLGVSGLRNAVAIVVRTGTVQAIEIRQASGNTGMDFNGPALAQIGFNNQFFRLTSGFTQPQISGRLGIRYVPGTLDLTYNGRLIFSTPINLDNINGRSILDPSGSAYVGFAGATSQFRTHDQRVDDVSFELISVPAPGAAALLGAAGLLTARRRR